VYSKKHFHQRQSQDFISKKYFHQRQSQDFLSQSAHQPALRLLFDLTLTTTLRHYAVRLPGQVTLLTSGPRALVAR
jgi:hypothetical protein